MTSDNESPSKSASSANAACRLYFQGQGPCLISRKFLNKCPILASRLAAKPFFSNSLDTINVEEIPYDIGVVVVYFLITGKYRCLDPKLDSQEERNCSDLGTAFRVYAAAIMFNLIGLKNVVQGAMSRLENMMDLAMIARVLKETGLNLDEYPALAMHIYSYIQISKDVSSREEMKSIIDELGFPESVNLDSFQSDLVSQGSLFEQRDAKGRPPPIREPKKRCSKGKNKVITTVAPSTSDEDLPKKTAPRTWASLLPKVHLVNPFVRSQTVSSDSTEPSNTTEPVDKIMMPAEGLSEESMVTARQLALSYLGQDLEEGDVGLQEGTFQVPPPVKDL